jgi:hypothetical protein
MCPSVWRLPSAFGIETVDEGSHRAMPHRDGAGLFLLFSESQKLRARLNVYSPLNATWLATKNLQERKQQQKNGLFDWRKVPAVHTHEI